MAYIKQNNIQTNNFKYPQGHNWEGLTPQQVNQGYKGYNQQIQQQEKKQYPKLETREFIGELKGKMLEDSGKKKDGTPWEKYRIIFKQDNEKYPEKIFKNQFTPFNFPKSLKIEELINKSFYRVLYVTENKNNTKTGNDYKFNRILGIYMHTNPKTNNQENFQNIPSKEQDKQISSENKIYDEEGKDLEEKQQPLIKLSQLEIDTWNNNSFKTQKEWIDIAYCKGISIERALLIEKEMKDK